MTGTNESLEHADLVRFAASRGGQLLSPSCAGAGVKHRWRCARGHEFEASPRLLIHGGYWCPRCAPSVEDTSGWDWEAQVKLDPLLAKFRRRP